MYSVAKHNFRFGRVLSRIFHTLVFGLRLGEILHFLRFWRAEFRFGRDRDTIPPFPHRRSDGISNCLGVSRKEQEASNEDDPTRAAKCPEPENCSVTKIKSDEPIPLPPPQP